MGPASSLSCFSPYKKILSGLPKKGRAYLLVVLVPREGQDFGAVSMGPAIDHKGLDTGLERKSMLHIEDCLIRKRSMLYLLIEQKYTLFQGKIDGIGHSAV